MAKAFITVTAGQPRPPARTSTDSNQVTFAGETIAVTAGQLTAGALLGNILVPKGAEIVGVACSSTDIDTGGSPAVLLEIGDAGDTDRLMAASNIGQSGGVSQAIAATGFGYRYPEETLVQVRVGTAPATAAGGTIRYGVSYVSQ